MQRTANPSRWVRLPPVPREGFSACDPDRKTAWVAPALLALGELEAAASLGTAVLFALDHPAVASKQSGLLEQRA